MREQINRVKNWKQFLNESDKTNLTPDLYDLVRSDEFKKWFDNSKVVDDNNNPLVVYHGGTSIFKDFKPNFDGIWFSDNINVAEKITGIIGLNKPKYSKKIIDILDGDYKNINDLWNKLIEAGFKIDRKKEEDIYGNGKFYISIIDKNGYEHKLSDYTRLVDVKNHIIKKGKNYAVFLKIINPFIINAKNNEWDNITFNGKKSTTMEIAIFAKENGFDGVIFHNLYEFGIKSNVYVVYDNNQINKIN